MRNVIPRSAGSLSSLGVIALVAVCALGGWEIGLNGSSLFGALAGLMIGLVAAALLFSLLLTRRPGSAAQGGFLGLSPNSLIRIATKGYLLVFFGYMFLPLVFMVIAAFNTPGIPQAIPFEGFTFKWFDRLFGNEPLWAAVLNSVIIGCGVICLSTFLGLAGALLLTRLQTKARTFIYGVLVSPLLTPGIILGISTLVFWNNLGVGGGLFLATLAQGTFISAYCMLLFMARLQRFDHDLEEAALDLGASHQQVFWKITVPFLKPTILTGAVIAFLQSFENFNTTVFAIGTDTTMTIQLASMARLSLTPEVNALAVIFIGLTVVIAIFYELKRRAERMKQEMQREAAARADAAMLETSGEPAAPLARTQRA